MPGCAPSLQGESDPVESAQAIQDQTRRTVFRTLFQPIGFHPVPDRIQTVWVVILGQWASQGGSGLTVAGQAKGLRTRGAGVWVSAQARKSVERRHSPPALHASVPASPDRPVALVIVRTDREADRRLTCGENQGSVAGPRGSPLLPPPPTCTSECGLVQECSRKWCGCPCREGRGDSSFSTLP